MKTEEQKSETLEWSRDGNKYRATLNTLRYTITHLCDGQFSARSMAPVKAHLGYYPTLEEAKAECQKFYDAL